MGQSLLFSCTNCKYKRELLEGAGMMTAYEVCFCADCRDLVSVQTYYQSEDDTEVTILGPSILNPLTNEIEKRPLPPLDCCPMCRGTNITKIDFGDLPGCPKCDHNLAMSVGALWE